MFNTLTFAACISSALARDVIFPPVSGVQHPLAVAGNPHEPLGDIDISTGSAFGGLTTYANLPYVQCYSADKEIEKFDIAFLGAPFDTGVTGRPGARFGPGSIRQASWRFDPRDYNIYSGESAFLSWAKVVDCGDPPLTPLDNSIALRQLEKAHRVIASRQTNSTSYKVPRAIMFGGDHTTTLAALRSTFKSWGKVSVIHFDAHIDTWDPAIIGGGLSHYAGVNHGTFLHIAHEEGLISNSSIHAGIRGPMSRPTGDLKNDARCGFYMIKARDIDHIGVKGVIEKVKERVQESRVYISVDIDVLDPAFAPGTGTPEVGGWSTRELLSVLDGLSGLHVVGADIVEVSPPYDNHGEITAVAAAEVARSLVALMVEQPVTP